jgi:hypothetical protein
LVKSSWGLAHPVNLTELALLDGRRPLPLWDVIGLTLINNVGHLLIFDNYSEFWNVKTAVK